MARNPSPSLARTADRWTRWGLVAAVALAGLGVAALPFADDDDTTVPWRPRPASPVENVPRSAESHRALIADILGSPAPEAIEAGDEFRFTVRLINPTSADIALEPCPVVRMLVDGSELADSGTQWHRLDCERKPIIEAGTHADFEMAMLFHENCCAVIWELWGPRSGVIAVHGVCSPERRVGGHCPQAG